MPLAASSLPATNIAQRLHVGDDKDLHSLDITAQVVRGSRPPLRGGMALIHRGLWNVPGADLRKQVAIKSVQLSAVSPQKIRRRLLREIRVWSSLNHPHVLPMYGIYHGLGDYPAMVAPWCENGRISRYLYRQRSSEHFQFLVKRAIRGILLGLQYLHSKNIVHGDLKCANILASDIGEPILCDFGLATVLTEGATPQTLSTVVKGTCRWMAPELLNSDDARHTKASDIWAFGCVVLELMTGRWPYSEEQTDQKVIIARSSGRLPQRTRPREISVETWQRMLHCWAFLPVRRPSVDTLLLLWEPNRRESPQWFSHPPHWLRRNDTYDDYLLLLMIEIDGVSFQEAFVRMHDSPACKEVLIMSRLCSIAMWASAIVVGLPLEIFDKGSLRTSSKILFIISPTASLVAVGWICNVVKSYGTPEGYANRAAARDGYPRWFDFIPHFMWASVLVPCILYTSILGTVHLSSTNVPWALAGMVFWCTVPLVVFCRFRFAQRTTLKFIQRSKFLKFLIV